MLLRPSGPLHWARLFQNFEKGKGALGRLGDESAHGGNAASEPTHILDPLGRLNLLNSLDLVWVCLDPVLRHKEPEKFAGRNSEDALLRVQLEVDLAQISNVSSKSCTSVALSLVLTTMSSI